MEGRQNIWKKGVVIILCVILSISFTPTLKNTKANIGEKPHPVINILIDLDRDGTYETNIKDINTLTPGNYNLCIKLANTGEAAAIQPWNGVHIEVWKDYVGNIDSAGLIQSVDIGDFYPGKLWVGPDSCSNQNVSSPIYFKYTTAYPDGDTDPDPIIREPFCGNQILRSEAHGFELDIGGDFSSPAYAYFTVDFSKATTYYICYRAWLVDADDTIYDPYFNNDSLYISRDPYDVPYNRHHLWYDTSASEGGDPSFDFGEYNCYTSKITVKAANVNIDQIMDDAKLIERVDTESTIDIDAIIADTDFNATLQGNYAVWEVHLNEYGDRWAGGQSWYTTGSGESGFFSTFPDDVIIRFAVNEEGEFYAGAIGPDADVLSVLTDGGVNTWGTWGHPIPDDKEINSPFLQLDARANLLASMIENEYMIIAEKGYKNGGPELVYASYGQQYGKALLWFDELKFQLINKFDEPITIILTALHMRQSDTHWACGCPFDGIAFKDGPNWRLYDALNHKWNPKARDTDDGDGYRWLTLNYSNVEASYVSARADGDNANSGYVKLDDTTVTSFSNWDPLSHAYRASNIYPENIELHLSNDWSVSIAYFRMAVLGGSVSCSNVAESPTGGMDENPNPLIWVIQPSISKNIIFEDNFNEIDTNKWIKFGSPSPRIISSLYGRNGVFDNNGDSWCNSGIITKNPLSLTPPLTIEADMYLDVTDVTGCWAGPRFTLYESNDYEDSGACAGDTRGKNPFLVVDFHFEGDACWMTPSEYRRHAYLDFGFITENGTWDYGPTEGFGALQRDDLIGGWHNYKVSIDSQGLVSFYVDDDLIYQSQNKIDISKLNHCYLAVEGRSSGSAGKAYHDFIKIYSPSPPSFNLTLSHTINGFHHSAIVGDADNDRMNELVIMNDTQKQVRIYDSNLNLKYSITFDETPICGVIADVDNDGKNELIVGTSNGNAGGYVYVGEIINGNFIQEWKSPLIQSFRDNDHLAVGDADNNGYKEIAVGVGYYGRYLVVYEYDGNGFTQIFEDDIGSDVGSVEFADVDNDGIDELIVGTGCWSDYSIRIYDNYVLTKRIYIGGVVWVETGDVDGDGLIEIVAACGTACGCGTSTPPPVIKIIEWNGADYEITWVSDNFPQEGDPCGLETKMFLDVGNLLYDNKDEIAALTWWANPIVLRIYSYVSNNYSCIYETNFTDEDGKDVTIGDYDNDGQNELIIVTTKRVMIYETSLLQNYIRVTPAHAIASKNAETTFNITIDNLPNGLSGYNITISLSNSSVAEIERIEFPEWASLHQNSSFTSSSVLIKAIDLNDKIKAGEKNVILATVIIKTLHEGITSINVGVNKLDDDNGYPINVSTQDAILNIIGLQPLPGLENPPTDPDNDGLFEDLNGNGLIDFDDVVEYFQHFEWIENNYAVNLIDFNLNGRIDFDDIVELFKEV